MDDTKSHHFKSKVNEEDHWDDLQIDNKELQNLLDAPFSHSGNQNVFPAKSFEGFDYNAGENWIYPNNFTERSYQFEIVRTALFNNTLVVLPPGLGKKFIAAVVMYNIHRWYPNSRIIFLAPTRQLVLKQISACQKFMPFRENEIEDLTEKLIQYKRNTALTEKRVFFATPQIIQSDLKSESEDGLNFDYNSIKLLVFDEAHKAKRQSAYSTILGALKKFSCNFRVLAMSSTPGRTPDDVAEIIRNLSISRIEIRFEDALDIAPYLQKNHIKLIKIPLTEKIKCLRESLLQIIDPYMRQLAEAEIVKSSLVNINRNYLLKEQKRFQERSQNSLHPQYEQICTNFSVCIGLYQALEILERHGLWVFLNIFEKSDDVNKFNAKFLKLITTLREELGQNPFEISVNKMPYYADIKIPINFDFGHTKFEEARKCLLQQFTIDKATHALVLCEYPETVILLYGLILQNVSPLKPGCLFEIGSSSGSSYATQKREQTKILEDFRSGKCNTLIALSICSDVLDVGEIDFIVCFDANTSNPVNFVQRIGGVGRNVVVLVAEGREHQKLKEVLFKKDPLNKKLFNSTTVTNSLCETSFEVVPSSCKPQCLKTYVKPSLTSGKKSFKTDVENKRRKKNLVGKHSHDLRSFFKKTCALDEYLQTRVLNASPQNQQITEATKQKVKDCFKLFDTTNETVNTQILQKRTDEKYYRDFNKFIKTSLWEHVSNLSNEVTENSDNSSDHKENFMSNEGFSPCNIFHSLFNEKTVDEEFIINFQSTWEKMFKGLNDLGPCCDTTDFINNLLMKTERYCMAAKKSLFHCSSKYSSENKLNMPFISTPINSECFIKQKIEKQNMNHESQWQEPQIHCLYNTLIPNDRTPSRKNNYNNLLDKFSNVNETNESDKENYFKNFEKAEVFSQESISNTHLKRHKSIENESELNPKRRLAPEFKEIINQEICYSPPRNGNVLTSFTCSSPKNLQSNYVSQQYATSPSLLDMYMKKARTGSQMQETEILKTQTLHEQIRNEEESFIATKQRPTKRRIIDSESDSNEMNHSLLENVDTKFERHPHNKFQKKKMCHENIRKRNLQNSFLDNEALVSGSENSIDECEYTIGGYLKDSVIVSSEEEDGSTSLMHEIYLRSLKSPQKTKGFFKIPQHRYYKDQSKIFSQPVLPVELSQYVKNSFVVSSDDDCGHNEEFDDNSFCPLEYAEKILKQEKRAKRRQLREPPTFRKLKRKRIQTIDDTDDEEFAPIN